MGDIRTRLASLSLSASLLVVVGALGGCGDNVPRAGATGGTGGGTGGSGATGGGTGGQGGVGGVAGGEGGLGGGAVGGLGGEAGGAGMGGAGGTTVACYTTAFTMPASNTTLTVADDVDHTCSDGFSFNVQITSGAPDNTPVSLYNGTTLLRAATVMNGAASFSVQLSSGSTPQTLSVQYPGTATCNVTRTVTVSCDSSAPTCSVSQPVISATHPALNGVQAPAGDRVSSSGSNYQVAFKVRTSAEDGQPVTLAFDNVATPTAVTQLDATASNGVATFTATLPGDGTYEAAATCTNKNGVSAQSAKGTYPVDITAPNLTVNSPTSGQFVIGANVNVCGQTSSTDAAALSAALGAAQNNFCVTVGSAATPSCTPVAAVNTSTCVAIPCPGAAAFNVTLTLTDGAGNPTSQTVTGVTCTSSLPSVQIVAPASDAPTFTDPSKHILSATAPAGVKDLDPNTAGAQANVVACTDTAGTAVLKVGHKGDAALTQLGGSVATAAAAAGDNCPAGLPNVVRFAGVTLPESTENADGTLSAATELTVTVTSSANAQAVGTSQPDDVWVDTGVPSVSLASPANLCGSFAQSSTTVNDDLAFTADDRLVVMDVTNGSVTTTYDTPAYMNGTATFPGVALTPGRNDLSVTISDPAGNAVILSPNPCSVTIGAAPVVTFTTPTAGALLCPAGATASGCIPDNDTGTPGWQGSLAVTVTAGGVPVATGDLVTFSDGGNNLGSANLDATGQAQLNAVTIPEGVQTIVATTAAIANAGVGTGNVTVTVDTTPPNVPTGLTVSVSDRRKTSMQLTWTAPDDGGGGNVVGYQIRYAKVPINDGNFNNASVTADVPYLGAPAAPGHVERINVTNLYIETDYYFAVAATDVTGNVGPILSSSAATRAPFLTTTLTGGTGDRLGRDLDGSGDFGGPSGFTPDAFSDLLVGGASSSQHVYLYFGSADGYSTTPSVTFTGSLPGFGTAVVDAGDLDGDQLDDIAISSSADGSGKIYIYSRKNPPASWGASGAWPANLTDTQANYVITIDPRIYAAGLMDVRNLARLGNFDATGTDDLAVSLDGVNGLAGVVFIVKGSSSFGSLTVPDPNNGLEIDGVGSAAFGFSNLGIGPFFAGSGTGGTAIVMSAILSSTNYAFAGRASSVGLTASVSDDAVTAQVASDRYGASLGLLGPLGPSPAAVTVGAPGGKYVDVNLGTIATGPFVGPAGGPPVPSVRLVDSASGNSFGVINFGSTVRGTAVVKSIVGPETTAVPDLVLAGQAESGSAIYIVSGSSILGMSGTIDVSAAASQVTSGIVRVTDKFPANWVGYATGALVPDVNNDGYADFAIGESTGNPNPGRVVVFY